MSVFRTRRGRAVDHFHVSDADDLSNKLVKEARDWLKRNHPNAIEVKLPTCKYGCHGYAFANRHGYFNYADEFIADDYEEIEMSDAQIEDVLVYTKIIKHKRTITHSAKVTDVDVNSEITEVRSKWGGMAEVLHAPDDTPRDNQGRRIYGRPTLLLRLTDFVPLDTALGVAVMKDEKTTREAINRAIEQFLDPDVYLLPMLASTPEVTEEIIENLPGVKDLIDIGPEAGAAALKLFQREETQSNHLISNIALYLLEHIPTKEATEPLAKFLVARTETIKCGDLALAARAFLAAAEINVEDEDFMSVALREAEKFK